LEAFVECGGIAGDRKAHFTRKCKRPEDFVCLFVIVREGANFVFYPYKT